ncbi:hypothetical protein OWV82_009361 [Melia azedarach]|uniref:Uncharacterized protein n=1 Tax=Melia azedarach TaxID=155640 RepID=A0ACC1YE82_MELAZ|nr:hypothetical protein OWV82_009361 [Melia azedarach]
MGKTRNNCPLDACEKFLKAITASFPFRTIRRISHHHQDSKPVIPPPNPSPQSSIPVVKTHHSAKHSKPAEYAEQHKTLKNGEAAEVVPVKFDNSGVPSATFQKNGQVSGVATRKEPLSQLVQVKKVATMHEAEVAERAQQKYKHGADNTPATNAVGYDRQGAKTNGKAEPPQVSRMESAHVADKFAAYINRAGNMIRTTSTVDGKNKSSSASAEDDGKDHFSEYINHAKIKMLRTMSSFVGGKNSDSMK